MDGEVDPDVILDYAIFNTSSRKNRYEASICTKEKLEKVSSGHLDLLELHLPLVRESSADSSDYFKLELPENLKGSSWFTKATLARYLQLVKMPDLLKKTKAIQSELNQLEDTRKFNLTLYTKDEQSKFGNLPAGSCHLNEIGRSQKGKIEARTCDASKNELLRALDMRVTALNQELAAIFSQALGNNCSKAQLSDLIAFVEYLGASELRDSLIKYSPLHFHEQSEISSHKFRNYDGDKNVDVSGQGSQIDSKNSLSLGISPAKIAQAERQSSSESDESSDSSEVVQSFVERSRPTIRSASPRRSASPMRRIQIGRSGSRRSTALTIKSLSYFPAREKSSFNREDNETNSESDPSEPRPNRSENAGLRMSVQDRINLFESKQRETLDTQKRNMTTEASFGAKKSVLRRWSAGMSDSSTPYTRENASDDNVELTSNTAESTHDKLSAEEICDIQKPNWAQLENSAGSLEVHNTSSSPVDIPSTTETPHIEETHNRVGASAQWTRQKQAELNQMLMKMTESKPATAKDNNLSVTGTDRSSKKKGNFYNQHKSKRDEKLWLENAGKKAEKEENSKVMLGKVDNKKTSVSSKVTGPSGKQDPSTCSQRMRRNSSPSMLAKTSSPKPVAARKSSPKAPAPSTGRNSSPSIPSPRTTGTPPSRISSGMTSSAKTNHRKPQSTSSPARTASQKGKPRQLKETRCSVTESKSNFKSKDDSKPKTMEKNSKRNKTKSVDPPGDNSGSSPAKPSLYNKVTKKSSVVPLESKPFLRKGTGIGSGVGPVSVKRKVVQPEDLSKSYVNVMQVGTETSSEAVEKMSEHHEEDPLQAPSVDMNPEEPVIADLVSEKTQESESFITEMEHPMAQPMEIPVMNIHADDESGISSSAWIEVDNGGDPASLDGDLPLVTSPADAMPAAASSPRIRHSLSQMLQAESVDSEIIEWGNAEIPPALVYQKDAPKGLKKLLKFARKSKGESYMTGHFGPTILSDGEEDTDEPRIINRRNADASLRKSKAKTTGITRTMLSESYDGGHPSKGSANNLSNHEFLSASMNGLPSGPNKLRERRTSAAASNSAKGTRSFFSLSTFRSNKSSEAKLR